MRISDWSSDVCSSDLDLGHLVADRLHHADVALGYKQVTVQVGHGQSLLGCAADFLPVDSVSEHPVIDGSEKTSLHSFPDVARICRPADTSAHILSVTSPRCSGKHDPEVVDQVRHK